MRKPIPERFWSKVPPPATPDGCMEWNGNRDLGGYGILRRGGKNEGTLKAHRVSWELTNGPIPAGMFVCHSCDNPPCVRPDHLFVGTVGDNNRDMFAKRRHGRFRQTGEAHHNAVLTVDMVRELRRRKAAGATYDALTAETGIRPATICAAVTGRTWAWLDRAA